MKSHPANDRPERIISRAVRSTALLGGLLVLLAPCAAMPAMILRGTGNTFAIRESPIYLILAAVIGASGAIFLCLAGLIHKRQVWAAIAGIVFTSLWILLAFLLLLGTLLVPNLTGTIAAGILIAMLVGLIIQQARVLGAVREEQLGARGFTPLLPDAQGPRPRE
jgi:hypothetical protein